MRDHGYLHDLAEMPPSQRVFNETKCNQIKYEQYLNLYVVSREKCIQIMRA